MKLENVFQFFGPAIVKPSHPLTHPSEGRGIEFPVSQFVAQVHLIDFLGRVTRRAMTVGAFVLLEELRPTRMRFLFEGHASRGGE